MLPGPGRGPLPSDLLQRSRPGDLDIKYPVEYVTLLAAANARLALECGYTSARSGEVCSTSMSG